MAPRTDRGHRAGMRHSQHFSLLQLSKPVPRLQSGPLGERRSFNFALQSDERFISEPTKSTVCQIRHVVKPRYRFDLLSPLRIVLRLDRSLVSNPGSGLDTYANFFRASEAPTFCAQRDSREGHSRTISRNY